MRQVVALVPGMVGGVVVYLVATQLALLTTGAGTGGRLIGVLATATLVAAAVMAGRRWPTAVMSGAVVVALLVCISLATFDGATPTGMLLSARDLLRYGASSHLPVALAAAGGVAAISGRASTSRPPADSAR